MSVWDVDFKFALKGDNWNPGKLGVDSVDGLLVIACVQESVLVKREIWTLESFIRQRRNPKLPLMHCQFDSKLIQQIQPGYKRVNSSADLVIRFKSSEADREVEAFEKEFVAVRKAFLLVVQKRVDEQASYKVEAMVDRYRQILQAIQSWREDFATRKRIAEAEQLSVARRSVLEANPDILASYEHLVQQEKSVTEEVFWARHESKVKAMIPLPTLDEPFFDFSTNADDDQKLAALLVESPYIQSRYKDLVEAGRLNQKEFWHRLMRSKYFSQIVGDQLAYGDPNSAGQDDGYFDAPNEKDSNECLEIAAQELVVPDLDVTSIPENPNKRDSNEELVQAGLRGVKLVTPSGLGGTAAHLEKGLLFADRLNNLADRSLHDRADKSCYYSVPEADQYSPQLQRIFQIGDETQLSAIASLMTLETSLNTLKDSPVVNVRAQVSKLRKEQLAKNVKLVDLDEAEPIGKQKLKLRIQKHTPKVNMRPANRIDRGAYAGKLRAAIADYKPHLDFTQNETVSKCCYVKFTKILSNATASTRQQQLSDLLQSESVLRYVEEVALVQNQVNELIHFIYDDTLEKNPQSLRQNLLQLQTQVENLMRHEIDTNGADSTGVMNSRTLCRPILYELEQAHKAFS